MQRHSFINSSKTVELHRMSYEDRGPSNARDVVLCVHGLTRNLHDFDFLAERLERDFRVLAVDVVGRGQSDWIKDKTQYTYKTYFEDIFALLDSLKIERVHWIGTSMGGLIGMMSAGLKPARVRTLVLNDIGPVVPKIFIDRLKQYVGEDRRFANLQELEATLHERYALTHPMTDEQWKNYTLSCSRRDPDGYKLNHDPGIVENFKALPPEDLQLWDLWKGVQCPTLVLRGEKSEALLKETFHKMLQTRANVEGHEIKDAGHTPSLMSEDQIAVIKDFLRRH